MPKQTTTFLIFILLSVYSIGQEMELILPFYQDSTSYKIVIRTEKLIDDRHEALDNMTVKVSPEETKVYYIRYDDGMISSLTFPWSITDLFTEFEQNVHNQKCESTNCIESIRFEIGDKAARIPIDVLNEELLSTFMLKLEE